MESKTKKVLFYVAVGLLVAAAVIFGIVEIAGGADDVQPVDSTVVEVVDTVQPVVLDSAVDFDTVVAE